jgi:hemerythrin-like metal-binding protein
MSRGVSAHSYAERCCRRVFSAPSSSTRIRKFHSLTARGFPVESRDARPGPCPGVARSRAITPQYDDAESVAAPGGTHDLPGFPLEWREAYECGHALLDAQHRTLFRDANALLEASQCNSPDVLARFDELISHVLGHFADEERILLQVDYPHLAAHRAAHAALTRTALKLREAMIHSHHRHEELLEFLVGDVVQRHLLVDDRRFFDRVASPAAR